MSYVKIQTYIYVLNHRIDLVILRKLRNTSAVVTLLLTTLNVTLVGEVESDNNLYGFPK